MGRINSRSKGSTFERNVARMLRDWLGEAWTVARNQTDRQDSQVEGVAGEFTIIGPKGWPFPWCIECKAHESMDYGHLWTGGVGPFDRFWTQATAQARGVNLEPMLIFKRNNGPILFFTRPHSVEYMETATQSWPRMIAFSRGERLVGRPLSALLAVPLPRPPKPLPRLPRER